VAIGKQFPKAIFYDSKNTLFDWKSQWIRACANILKKYAHKADSVEFQKTWHRQLVAFNAIGAFSKYRSFSDHLKESLIYTLKYYNVPGSGDDVREMLDLWTEVVPFPDAAPALKDQQKFTKVWIFSNVETRYLKMMADKLTGFTPDFQGDMEIAQMSKPSPSAYNWVLAKNGLRPSDVIYCAGPQWDVQGAIAAGMRAVWLNRTGQALDGVKPDWEVKDLHGVTAIVRDLLEGKAA
jgi:2-haloalkanoic acid dehalogenase type II